MRFVHVACPNIFLVPIYSITLRKMEHIRTNRSMLEHCNANKPMEISNGKNNVAREIREKKKKKKKSHEIGTEVA